MLKSNFEELLSFLKDKNVLIISHDLVDIDGFVSCINLKYFINQIYENLEVSVYFSDISKVTKIFIEKFLKKFKDFKLELKEKLDFSRFDLIIILDTNNLDQVIYKENINIIQLNIPFIFIDHHVSLSKKYSTKINPLNLILEDFSSTAEIILELYEAFNVSLSLPYKFLLITGILTDSGFFKYCNNDTIKRISKLLEPDIDIQEIMLMLNIETEIPERLAKIKGLQRVEIIREGSWLIGITRIGSYESSVASLLIRIGFDVGVVISEKKSEYRISTRARKSLCLRSSLHMGKILEEISIEYGCSGGGHDGAAALNGKNDLEKVLNKIIKKIKESIN